MVHPENRTIAGDKPGIEFSVEKWPPEPAPKIGANVSNILLSGEISIRKVVDFGILARFLVIMS